ncbi:MAG TPA: hypothetical protein VGK46_12200, partial [Saprospiraceae bacterium]
MKTISTPLSCFVLLMFLVLPGAIRAQEVGIGTFLPDHRLHVYSNTSNLLKLENSTPLNVGVMSEMFFKSGTHYTGAVKTIGNGTLLARLGFFTYAATSSGGLLERMSIMDNGAIGIGTNTPGSGFLLDVNGRTRVRSNASGGGTAGIAFMDAANANNRGFIGMEDDNTVGLYGYNGAGWGLTMNTITGGVIVENTLQVNSNLEVIGAKLYATNNIDDTGWFINTSGQGYAAVYAEADFEEGEGTGVYGEGGEIGLFGIADMAGGAGHRYGVKAYGNNGAFNNYGVHGTANGGNSAIGIYGYAAGGTSTWGGYFSGSVYTSGSYQGSDRKLKNDIRPLNNAISLIKALKPSTY